MTALCCSLLCASVNMSVRQDRRDLTTDAIKYAASASITEGIAQCSPFQSPRPQRCGLFASPDAAHPLYIPVGSPEAPADCKLTAAQELVDGLRDRLDTAMVVQQSTALAVEALRDALDQSHADYQGATTPERAIASGPQPTPVSASGARSVQEGSEIGIDSVSDERHVRLAVVERELLGLKRQLGHHGRDKNTVKGDLKAIHQQLSGLRVDLAHPSSDVRDDATRALHELKAEVEAKTAQLQSLDALQQQLRTSRDALEAEKAALTKVTMREDVLLASLPRCLSRMAKRLTVLSNLRRILSALCS